MTTQHKKTILERIYQHKKRESTASAMTFTSSTQQRWITLECFLVYLFVQNCAAAIPTFTTPIGSPSLLIDEDTASGVAIYTVAATDADNGVITYTIHSQSPGTPVKFAIDSETGQLTTTEPFDYETDVVTNYTIIFRAETDSDGSSFTATMTLNIQDINDNTPTFSPAVYHKSVVENTVQDTSLVLLTVTDDDTSDSVTISILSGDDTTKKFAMNGKLLKTSSNPIDYDVLDASNFQYTLMVIASDGTNIGTATVFITVTNENEADPTWGTFSPPYVSATTAYDIAEDSVSGTTVVTVAAADTDAGDDGEILYSLWTVISSSGKTPSGLFTIDQFTGILTTTSSSFDRDPNTGGVEYYDLTVKAIDQGTSPHSAEITVRVGLTDVNDNTPTFSPSLYYTSVAENAAQDTTVVLVTVTDDDVSDTVTVSILSGDDASKKFIIDAANGKLIVTSTNPIDYDMLGASNFQYTLTVIAFDGTNSGTCTIFITIISENEADPTWETFAPAYISATTAYDIAEDSASGTTVVTIAATDADAGVDGEILYSIWTVTSSVGTSATEMFDLDQDTGVLTTTGSSFDRDPSTGGVEYYDVILKAIDQGTPAHSAERTVRVGLTDVNDNTPTFSPSVYYTSVVENTAQYTSLVVLTVTDDDVSDTVTVTILSGDDVSKKFDIDATNGKLLTTSLTAIDYDVLSASNFQYVLIVKASDGTNTATATVIITVTNENEADPAWGIFLPPYVSATTAYDIAEDSVSGTIVVTIAATDTDAGDDGNVQYIIVNITSSTSATVTGLFDLDQVTGVLTTTGNTLDRDPNTGGVDYYDVIVKVTDQGTSARSAERTVRVGLTDVNDNTPTFSPTVYYASVTEHTAADTSLVLMTVTDDDVSDTVTVSILSGDDDASNKFAIDVINGKLIETSTNEIDYDILSATNYQYTLIVIASDGSNTDTATVIITVTNDNEHNPTWVTFVPAYISPTIAYDIAEDSASGTSIVTIAASDTDAGLDGDILYTLGTVTSSVNTTSTGLFYLDKETGVLTTTGGSLDRDVNTGGVDYYDVIVKAIDQGTSARSAERSVRVGLTDVNDNTPTFSPTVYYTSVAENTAQGISLVLLAVTDDDASDTVTVSILSGDDDLNKFAFDVIDEKLILTAANAIDYDVLSASNFQYTLTVTASDGTNIATATVFITVTNDNEHDPTWGTFTPAYISATTAFEIAEDSTTGTTIVTVAAADVDAGVDGQIFYYLGTVTSSKSTTATGMFLLDQMTGVLTTSNSSFDRDPNTGGVEYYDVIVKAIDEGTPARTAERTVRVGLTSVNDNTPTFYPTVYYTSVTENTAQDTSLVLLTVTDDDAEDSVTLSILSGDNALNKFAIDSTNGMLLQTSGNAVDYDVLSASNFQYTLTVTASDGTNTGTATVFITITNINEAEPVWEAFTPAYLSATTAYDIAEDSASGTSIVTVVASDTDAGVDGQIIYSLGNVISSASTTVTGLFDLDQLTGILSTTGNTLDRDPNTGGVEYYDVIVRAIDHGTPALTAERTVRVGLTDVNDNMPIFSPTVYYTTVVENTAQDTSLVLLTVTDHDISDTVSISVLSGDDDASKKFVIDATNGKLIITSSNVIDYDVLSASNFQYTLIVIASDGTNAGTATVIVTVTNENEADPEWETFSPAYVSATTPYDIAEDSSSGTSIVTIQTSDRDAGSDGEILYFLGTVTSSTNTIATGLFELDQVTGVLTTTSSSFDRDPNTGGVEYYDVIVIAIDHGTPARSAERTLRVGLTDVNDNMPTFTPTVYYMSIIENTIQGTSVVLVTVTDDDVTDTVTVSILSGDDDLNKFAIDATNGKLIVTSTNAIDFDVLNDSDFQYTLIVMASDGTNTVTANVFITITNINEAEPAWGIFAPVYVSATTAYDIAEDSISGTTIVTLAATDADAGVDGQIFYSLGIVMSSASTPATGLFDLDPVTGVLTTTSNSFDRDPNTGGVEYYDIIVKVTDRGTSALSAERTVRVGLTDVNDNTPTFSPTVYYTSVSENTAQDTLLAMVTVTDNDVSDTVTVSILSGDDAFSNKFAIDATNGKVIETSANAIDYDLLGASNFQYTLTVIASDGMNTGTATVIITVTNENEADPAWETFTPPYTSPTTAYDIAEDSVSGTTIVTVVASDTDAGVDGQILYTLWSVTSSAGTTTTGLFDLDHLTGMLTTTSNSFDRDPNTGGAEYYDIIVRAIDQGTPARTAERIIRVGLTDVNDNTPTFSSTFYYKSIVENAAQDTSVVLLTVTDDDVSDTVTVRILSGDDVSNKFAIDATNGKLITTSANPIDYDVLSASNYRYTLTVVASDGMRMGTTTVYITVTNENEYDPEWGSFSPAYVSATTPYNIAEDCTTGTTAVTIAATDLDAEVDGQILYFIWSITASASTTTTGLFHLDKVSGVLTTTSNMFDRDPNTGGVEYYDLIVKAIDQGTSPRSAERTLRVQLIDVNDNTPTFAQNIYTVTFPETTIATTSLLTLVVTDNDVSSTLTYSIETSSTPSAYTTYFELDTTNTNQLNLKAIIDLDSGTVPTYNLVIKVSDAASAALTSTTQVTVTVITVNEHDPVFGADVTINYDEDSAIGTTVTTVAATDADTGTDGDLTYSIIAGNNNGEFAINTDTGEIVLSESLDFESTQQYILTVKATDGGTSPHSDTTSVTINVIDVSDETPTCTTNVFTVSIDEPGVVFANVVALSCSDNDAIDTLSYGFGTSITDGKFAIDATGQITLIATLDYDTGITHYALVVEVTDGTTTLEIPVSVTVNPINENAPMFDADVTVTFAENTLVGSTLVTHAAIDSDASPHNIQLYEISAVTNSGSVLFTIDPNTGQIKLVKSLDYETSNKFVITVVAVDGGTPTALMGTGSVTIQVSDVNDVTPSCIPAVHVLSVAENTNTGTDVISSFGCTDSDGSSLSYSITSQTPSSNFVIDTSGETPTLRISSGLDYETSDSFEIEVTVTDGGLSTIVNVDISVADVNDGGPSFSSGTYSASVAESASVGQSVTTITATDPDSSTSTYGLLSYSILSGNGDNKFNINPSTAKISVAGVLNADTSSTYTLVIQAIEDSADNSATANVVITVSDVNDNTPTCTSDLAFSLTKAEEGTIGDTIHSLVCTDADGDALTYTMTSGDSTYFEMSSADLNLIAVIDFDTVANPQFDFVIDVSDGTNMLTVTGSLTITAVNEDPPVFSQTTYSVSKAENTSPGNLITTVVANDDDKDDTITFSWLTSTTAFTLDQSSGQILLAGTLDRETTPSYSLEVEATDGTNSVTATVMITVTDENDNSPIFNPNTYSITVSEGDPSGITVATMTASDADDPGTNDYGTILYSITGGNTVSRFTIGTSNGEITTALALDYEVAKFYTLYVQASDSAGGAGSKHSTAIVTVTVDPVNEADPVFGSTSYATSRVEDTAIGTRLLQVVATDTDAGDDGTVYYSMNTHTNFYFDSNTGELFLKDSLDYEIATTHTLSIVAHDSGTAPRSATVDVTITVTDVNDATPSCTPVLQTVSYAEDATAGLTVASLTCSDSDGSSPNNALSYTIISVNGGVSATPFAVSPTGVITLDTGQSFDYESTTAYSILVRVSDGGTASRSTTATVKVDITDYNENNPVFGSVSYSFSLSESTTAGTSVFAVAATDSDTAQSLRYDFDPLSSNFGIDANTGDIFLTAQINYDTNGPNPFELVVVATDDGNDPSTLSVSATITVTVLDANDVTPVFTPAVYAVSISENDATGTTVTTVTASDADDVTVIYSLVDTFSIFQIDTNGVITIQNQVQDYEAVKSYILVVHATDGATPITHTGSTTVHVEITSYNEHTPIFGPASASVILNENSATGTTIIDTDATDADDGDDGTLIYSISSEPAGFNGVLAIDPNSGIVTVAGDIDREAVSSNPLSFSMQATDGGIVPGALTATFSLTLTIDDVNDNTPECSLSLYSASISEDAAAITSVSTIICTDSDTDAPNNVITYTVVNGNDGNFVLDASSGVISIVSTTPTLDRETTSAYQLVIEAADGGTPRLSTTTTLTVSIIDVNDNSPIFTAVDVTFSLDEDQAVGTIVGTVAATDQDSGNAGSFTYSIFSGDTDSNLAIDSNTGEIKVVGALDYELTHSYTLIIHATDQLVTVNTGTGTVTVNVNDINDVTPSCTPALQSFSVQENTAATTNIGTMTCTDTDSGANGDISYVISTVDGVATNTPFQLDASTGEFDLLTASLDYESDQQLIVIVHAIDGGTPALTGTATINVIVTDFNEHTPTFTSTPYTQTIVEASNIGDSVFIVTASDLDTSNTIKFSIDPVSTEFDIDPSTGELSLIATLDYEGTQTYEVTVLATDNGVTPKTGTATVTITVTDANDGVPVFSPAVYASTISENDRVGTTVTTVTATDSDSGSLTYSIMSGDDDAVFRIETSGLVIIDSTTNLDYDSATKSYTLVVTADDGTHTGTTTVAVVVTNYNDNTPEFGSTSSTQTLPEDSTTGTAVVTVAAMDTDHGDDGTITYSITAGNSDGLFAIDPSSGAVTLVGALNMESTQAYTITITATDGGTNLSAHTALYFLTVQVSDVNDVTPICTSSLYSATVSESIETGTSVSQLTCSDTDVDSPNNEITMYNIVSGNTNGDLAISVSGEITNVNTLDRELVPTYSLVIDVIDSGTPALTTTTTLTVTVSDVNDNKPTFVLNPYHVTTSEDVDVGNVVGTVSATDGDSGNAGTVTYVLTTDSVNFEIDSASGEIKIVAELDYETVSLNPYVLVIEGRDNGGTISHTGSTTVSITITDTNDNTPSCAPVLQSIQFAEDISGSTHIASLTCTDADSAINADLAYAVISVNGDTSSTLFAIDAVGDITTSASTTLDYESTTTYSILLRVSDGGTPSLSFTATVQLDITDVNEASPVFQDTPYTTNVAETTLFGTVIYTVSATDSDRTGTVKYKLNPSNTYFNIDENSGQIYIVYAIDYDTIVSKTITLTVEASDDGIPAQSATESVTISVTNADDEIPTFIPGVYTGSLEETSPTGTTVTTVTVTDIDNLSLTFSFASGNTDNIFQINTNGDIVVIDDTNLDYDNGSTNYVLVVHAVDSGANTGTTTIVVQIDNINEASPSLSAVSNSVNIAENSAAGTSVDDVDATDTDAGADGDITYSISTITNGGDGLFTIDPISGLVSTSGTLDRETHNEYEITILATDAGTNPNALSATYSLTVTVTDENDVTPTCTQPMYLAMVSEDATVTTSVAQITCTDADAEAPNNDINTYTITSGNTGIVFNILDTGQVNINGSLDREILDNYQLVIEVEDDGTPALTTTTTLTITVTDENDNDPAFATDPYNVNVDEDIAQGTTVVTVAAKDDDIGDYGIIVYSIASGDTDSKFTIGSTSGEIILYGDLDFEAASQNPYILVIYAEDSDAGSPKTGSTTVMLAINDKNDNTPVCSPLLNSVSSAEDVSLPTTLVTLSCTDADSLTNADLSYSLTPVNGETDSTQFAVDTSGAVRLTTNLDYETTSSYTILVEVSDKGTPSLTVTATVNVDVIDVNDNMPRFTNTPYSTNILENTEVGTTVFQVAATDDDTNDKITFSLNPTMTHFDIDPQSGEVTYKATIDYETASNPYEVIVVATDDGTNPRANSASTTVTITVTNFNDGTPEFDPGVYAVSLSENEANGHILMTMTVVDVDDTSFTYNIDGGNGDNIFGISGTTETVDITISDNTHLDYESTKVYSLVIRATDPGGLFGTATVEIEITGLNEYPPNLSPATSTQIIAENSAAGTTVVEVDATDNDDGDDGAITFAINSGANGKFAIDPTTGVVTVSGSLDREGTNSYTVLIDVIDKGTTPSPLSSQYTLIVIISDVNDYEPSCSSSLYSASLSEDAEIGTTVSQLTCTDADFDSPNNDISSYVIASGNTGGEFLISSTGEVTTTVNFDRESTDNYQLEILVTDSGNTPSALSTTTTMTIIMTDVNDNDPAFAISPYNFNQDETIAIGTTVGTVVATDSDIGLAGSITYSIFSGNGDSKFAMDSKTGEIKLVSSLDYETTTDYTLVIYAIDKKATFRTGSTTVSITVNDINDNEPLCTAALYTGSVSEDAVTGTSVATVVCFDGDSTAGNTISYTITSDQTDFAISSNSGVVTTTVALDIEAKSSYDITVQASDGSFVTDVTVTVTLIDVNDNTPLYDPTGPYLISINENIAIGSTVYDVNATDADIAVSTFIFSITAGNGDSKFKIGASSGVIQTQRSIDRDDSLTTSYTLTIEVADGTVIERTATTSIVIAINDENDNYPSCDATSYTVTFTEDTTIGTVLISPVCSDADTVASPTPAYSIANGNSENKFQINSVTGVLTLEVALDYESTASYALTINVDDQGTSNLVTRLTMTIYIDPVNEYSPVFQNTPYDVSINEDVVIGYQIIRISAIDDDTGSTHGSVRYDIKSGNTAGPFSIDPSTGWITVYGLIDRENTASYSLTVTASDMISGDSNAKSAENTFVITVDDINDNYPAINPSSYAKTVNEDISGTAANVIQILATDDDDGTAGTAGLQYSITSGNIGTQFGIGTSTGWITLDGNVDANAQSIYILTVKVADQGNPVLSSLTIVTIRIVAVNEHAPTFSVTNDTVKLSEIETVGNSIYQAAASDSDTGDYAVLRYYLISGNTANEFNVNLFDGTVRVANALDYDTAPTQYILIIEVQDTEQQSTADTQSATMTLTIDLTDENDETPTFSSNTYSTTLDENVATSTSVITVMATDADSSINGAVTYSIVSGTGVTVFAIDGSSGLITSNAAIDFETLSSYDLGVQAIDGGISPLSSTCLVQITIADLNDNIPVFQVTSVAISITESTVFATTIATVEATDADSIANNNNIIVYSFSPTLSKFGIDSASGAITVSNVFDRETTASYTLIILATDQGNNPTQNTGTVTYTVMITDENDNPPVVSGTYYTAIAEDTTSNSIIFNITATDEDERENSVLTFTITSGNTDNDFSIDSASGLIQVKNSLDRERTNIYHLEVSIADNGASPQSVTVTATVIISDTNDNSPVFQPDPTTSYAFSVFEDVPVGSFVDHVSATDADTGVNGAIVYVIAYTIRGNNTHFTLDESTGMITTSSSLDRETEDMYVLIVRASDGGTNTLTSTVTVSISILDFNDNIPAFSQSLYTATTTENQATGTSILTVVITDLDTGVNNDITLSIADDTSDVYIGANSSSYILYVKSAIDRETYQSFSFVLTATDQGVPPLSFTTSVEITIGDANDNNPVFSPTFYNSEIAYNDDCQVTIATIVATDLDDGVNAVLTYSVTSNSNPHLFYLDSSTGDITLIANAVASMGYKMYAAATDAGSKALTSSTGATVRIDTYDPLVVVLRFHMNISTSVYLGMETTFLDQLTTVHRQNYQQSQVKRRCVEEVTPSSCIAHIYVIKNNNDTNEDSEINTGKVFLSADEAYAMTASDAAGTPADVITGIGWASFSITKVEKYTVDYEIDSTAWIQTTVGLVTISALAATVCILFLILLICVLNKIRSPEGGQHRNRIEAGDDDDGDKVANDQYHRKQMTIHTVNHWKPYDKSHPPPAVVALQMPYATKKVPMQLSNKSKDVNVFSIDTNSPTLVKKPEKLRTGSPVPTEIVHAPEKLKTRNTELLRAGSPETVQAPRRLPPLQRPPSARPPPLETSEQDGPDLPYDDINFMFLSREYQDSRANDTNLNIQFDGRAIDPASGRLYEYSTRSGERRWVNTTNDDQLKLTLDD